MCRFYFHGTSRRKVEKEYKKNISHILKITILLAVKIFSSSADVCLLVTFYFGLKRRQHKKTDALIIASKEICLELNSKKTKYLGHVSVTKSR